ncbi:MAG: hypothetical protein PHX78_04085 [bacterium]|nr:hypothetical protein [bacterium]
MNEENITSEPVLQVKEEPQAIHNIEKKQLYPMGKGMKFIFYMLSFLIFPGIVFGAAFYSKDDPEYRNVGKNCIYIALIPLLFYLFIIFIALFSTGQVGDVFGDSIKDVAY